MQVLRRLGGGAKLPPQAPRKLRLWGYLGWVCSFTLVCVFLLSISIINLLPLLFSNLLHEIYQRTDRKSLHRVPKNQAPVIL